jgi:hypothetical protein
MQDVFMEQYIVDLVKALHPFGDVLEVGFTSATKEIEKYRPQSQTIIDPHLDEALKWAEKHPSAKVIGDIWPSALPQLGVFDTIYFGIDPHEHPLFPNITKIRYQDSDLELFCEGIGSGNKKELARFLAELEQNGQISPEQKEKMAHKHHLSKEKPPVMQRSDQMLLFLKQCLASHMRKGSRFSCLLNSNIDDPRFYNEIVVDPQLDCSGDGRIIVIEKLT